MTLSAAPSGSEPASDVMRPTSKDAIKARVADSAACTYIL
jgi:hypothetical protein